MLKRILGLLLMLASSAVLAIPAGYVHDLSGTLTSQRGNEPARALKMGDTLEPGVTLATGGKGTAVLKFEDGQLVTLSPGTQFAVREYNYNKKSVKDSSMVFALLRGGLRFVTGVIGATNRNNFKLTVGTATIGVRGTDGWASYVEGLVLAAVNQGALEFTTPAGTQTIPVNSSAVVSPTGQTFTAPTTSIAAVMSAGGVPASAANAAQSATAVQQQMNNVQIPINTPVVIAAAAQAAQVVATARVAQAVAAAAAKNVAAATTPEAKAAAEAAALSARTAAAKATALATAAIATAQQAAVQALEVARTAGAVPATPPPPTPAAAPLTAVVPTLTSAQIQAQAALIQASVVTQTGALQATQTTLGLPVTNPATIQNTPVPPPPAATEPPPPPIIPVVIPPPTPTTCDGAGQSPC